MNIGRSLRELLKEPLVQFVALGALLFAADRYLVPGDQDNPRRILINAARRQELATIFEEGQGRPPTPAELQDLIVQWSQNEVLYREARLMGLDEGDEMIRQRLILKLRNIVFGNVVVPTPSEAELRAWFAANKSEFDRPQNFDFEQFKVNEAPTDGSEALALASQLGTQPALDDGLRLVRSYKARARENLFELFGQADAQRLLQAPTHAWVAVSTDRGWHLARITARHGPQPADFASVRTRVARGWADEARKASLSQSLKAIVEQFDIRVTPDPPPGEKRAATQAPSQGPVAERTPRSSAR